MVSLFNFYFLFNLFVSNYRVDLFRNSSLDTIALQSLGTNGPFVVSDFLKKNCIEPLNESFRSGLVQEIDPAKNIFVKVLLEEIDIKDKRDWKISSENGIIIDPINEIITINDQQYHGSLHLIKHKNSYLLINKVKLEEYIFSVLKTESWPGWPLEVNKVLAIACRSYAVAKILEAKKANLLYHIKPTNYHQTYTGIHFNEILRQATLETSGIIMSHNKKPILAMFDCCCGGIIPAHTKRINISNTPYLARNYPCNFCKNCKIFNWKFKISEKELIDILKKEIKYFRNLTDIKINTDKAGIVEKILFKDGRKTHSLTGRKFYSLFKEIKSFVFDIKKDKNNFNIIGKGYGHHIGLCQWGARQMINEGWNYRNILKFYYPDIKFVRLK